MVNIKFQKSKFKKCNNYNNLPMAYKLKVLLKYLIKKKNSQITLYEFTILNYLLIINALLNTNAVSGISLMLYLKKLTKEEDEEEIKNQIEKLIKICITLTIFNFPWFNFQF